MGFVIGGAPYALFIHCQVRLKVAKSWIDLADSDADGHESSPSASELEINSHETNIGLAILAICRYRAYPTGMGETN